MKVAAKEDILNKLEVDVRRALPLDEQDKELQQSWTAKNIREQQVIDKNSKPILTWLSISTWAQWDSLELKDGALYRRWENNNGNEVILQLFVPQSMRQNVFGVTKTLKRLPQIFFGLVVEKT